MGYLCITSDMHEIADPCNDKRFRTYPWYPEICIWYNMKNVWLADISKHLKQMFPKRISHQFPIQHPNVYIT